MKIKILLVLLLSTMACFTASAQKVTMQFRQVKLAKVFDDITRQTGLTVAYTRPTVNPDRVVTIQADNQELSEVLGRLFSGTNVTYEIGEKKIYLKEKPASDASLQKGKTRKISGIIVDEKGEPIIGASVQVKATGSGTITDLNGKFSMEVPENAVITISYLGYRSMNIPANSRELSRIVLKEDSEMLDEVVVVGYGTQRKRDVTTSISSIRASDIADVAATSIEQALVGRMAGVQITQPNGTPGAGFEVKVRGVGTVTAGSSPLYVIDGVPLSDDAGDATGITVSPLASIETTDIESIEVLKDASAAAIYGSRGSNGVVIITTKQGKEGKPVLKYNGYAGAQMVTDKIDVLNAYDYAQLVFDGHNNAYYDQLKSAGKSSLYDPYATNQQRWDNLKTGSINENQGWMLPPRNTSLCKWR